MNLTTPQFIVIDFGDANATHNHAKTSSKVSIKKIMFNT